MTQLNFVSSAVGAKELILSEFITFNNNHNLRNNEISNVHSDRRSAGKNDPTLHCSTSLGAKELILSESIMFVPPCAHVQAQCSCQLNITLSVLVP